MRWDDEKDISTKCNQTVTDTWIQGKNEYQGRAGCIAQEKTKR